MEKRKDLSHKDIKSYDAIGYEPVGATYRSFIGAAWLPGFTFDLSVSRSVSISVSINKQPDRNSPRCGEGHSADRVKKRRKAASLQEGRFGFGGRISTVIL